LVIAVAQSPSRKFDNQIAGTVFVDGVVLERNRIAVS